ncbi:MAG: TolC family protein [Butyricimonas paravirosa]
MPHYGNNFAIKATQVVYAGGAINRSIQLSELQQQVAELELQDNRQEVRFLLVGYYLELYQLYNQQEVYEKNIEQTRLLVKEIQAAFQQGTALKSDITRYELQLQNLELGLTSTRNRIKILNRQLTTTIGLAPETVILPDTTVLARNIERRDELSWQGMKK